MGAVGLLLSLGYFSPWLLAWVFGDRQADARTRVGEHVVTMAKGWFPVASGDSVIGSLLGLEQGSVVFAKARGVTLGQIEFFVIGPTRASPAPGDLAGLAELVYPWGKAYLFQPTQVHTGKLHFVLPDYGLFATSESTDVLNDIVNIQQETKSGRPAEKSRPQLRPPSLVKA